MRRIAVFWLTAVFLLALTGCASGDAASKEPEISAAAEESENAESVSSESGTPVQTGLVAEQVLPDEEGEIHYSYYLPESYDGHRQYPMMVVMPGYDMMWFGEDSSGSNLNWIISHSK